MHVPRRLARAVLVRSVAPPEALDQRGCRDFPTVHVLLPLLLLNLQGKSGAQDAGRQGEEGDAADGAEGGHDLPLPRHRHAVPVTHRAQRDHSPPEGVGKTGKVLVVVLLHHVDDEGGEDEHKEPDVQGCDQLLSMSIDNSAKELPGASTSIHTNHPENLEEPKSSQGRGSVHPSTKSGENDKRGADGDDVDQAERRLHEVEPADPALEP